MTTHELIDKLVELVTHDPSWVSVEDITRIGRVIVVGREAGQ